MMPSILHRAHTETVQAHASTEETEACTEEKRGGTEGRERGGAVAGCRGEAWMWVRGEVVWCRSLSRSCFLAGVN